MRIGAFAHIRLQHRGHRLLELQEQRVVLRRHQERDPAAASDAADADDLDGRVDHPVLVQQLAAFFGQRLAIGGKDLMELGSEFRRARHFRMEDQGRRIANADVTTDHSGELGKLYVRAGARFGLAQPLFDQIGRAHV